MITNVQGSVTSSPAILTVNVPAFVTTPPANQTVSPGSNVVFGVTAGGTLPLSYQWRFNGSNILGRGVLHLRHHQRSNDQYRHL